MIQTVEIFLAFIFFILACNYIYISNLKQEWGSDHYVHKLIIDLIKQNGNRFIKNVKPFLIGNMMGYPQLYHWILSYLTESQLKFIIRYQNILMNLTILFLHCSFSFYLASSLKTEANSFQILLYAPLLLLSSGILFDGQNARNTGLSARSIGFIIGQIFTYCCYFYFRGDYYVIFSFPLLMLLSLLASQFTTQFIIIASVILSLLFMDYLFILSNISGILLFALFFPSTSKIYMVYQWKHKKYYAKYGTKIVLLAQRMSIWCDFIHIARFLKEKGIPGSLSYMYNNPIVKVLTGVPCVMFVLYIILRQFHYDKYFIDSNLVVLMKIIVASFVVFIITSFKYTRFLGEPERYVEFTVSIACAVAAIQFVDQPLLVILIVILGLPRLIVECHLIPHLKTIFTNKGKMRNIGIDLSSLRKEIEKSRTDNKSIRILSNNFEITKQLLDIKWEYFYGWLFFLSEDFDPRILYKENAIISEEYLAHFINKYNISHVIIDTRTFEGNIQEKIRYQKKVWTDGRLELYLV